MAAMQVGLLVGSLRKQAWTRKIAEQLIALSPAEMSLAIVDIGHLPFYNEDEETATPPAAWTQFRQEVAAKQGIIFVTPEYNRSVPAVLKNAVDVGSRPWGKSIWNGKPCAVVSSSVGAIGGFAANHHLRQSFVTLNAPCMPSETYLGAVGQLFDESGKLNNPKTVEFLQSFLQSFAVWIKKFS